MTTVRISDVSKNPLTDNINFVFKLNNLFISNNNINTLWNDCKLYLDKLNHTDLLRLAYLMDINVVFTKLFHTTNKEKIEIICSLIQKFLSVLPLNYVLESYLNQIISATYNHHKDTVQSSIVSDFAKKFVSYDRKNMMPDFDCVLNFALISERKSVSANALQCLKNLEFDNITKVLPLFVFHGLIIEKTEHIIHSTFFPGKKIEKLDTILTSEIFRNLILEDIKETDIMKKVLVITMFAPFHSTQLGHHYLKTFDIYNRVRRLLYSSSWKTLWDKDPTVIYYSTLAEFYVRMFRLQPRFILQYPNVICGMLEILKRGDKFCFGITIKLIADLASSPKCKFMANIPVFKMNHFFKADDKLDIWSKWIIELDRIATSSELNMKILALQAIKNIIEVQAKSPEGMTDFSQKWFKKIKGNPIKTMVYSSCISPIFEIQKVGFEMLQALANQPWGLREIKKCPKILLVVFKCNRSDYPEIKVLKKSIINILGESDIFKKIILWRIEKGEFNRALFEEM